MPNNDEDIALPDRTALERACEFLDVDEEQAKAELGVNYDIDAWPDSPDLLTSRTALTKDECES